MKTTLAFIIRIAALSAFVGVVRIASSVSWQETQPDTPHIVVVVNGTPYALASMTPPVTATETATPGPATPLPTPTRMGAAQTHIANITATYVMKMRCDNPIMTVRVVSEGLNIREQPSASARRLGTLSKGDESDVVATSGGWLQICGGGWVNGAYVSRIGDRK